MMLRAYSLFDNKALQYHPPFFASTHGAATRMISDLVSDTNNQVGRHPGDFVLYCVGSYDDGKGAMLPVSPLEHVVDAVALVKIQKDMFSGLKPNIGDDGFNRPAPNGSAA